MEIIVVFGNIVNMVDFIMFKVVYIYLRILIVHYICLLDSHHLELAIIKSTYKRPIVGVGFSYSKLCKHKQGA